MLPNEPLDPTAPAARRLNGQAFGGPSTMSLLAPCHLPRVARHGILRPMSSRTPIPATAPLTPEGLPFLESLSWFDARWRELSPFEMLKRYERGFRHRGVTADLSAEEAAFLRGLIRCFGSDLDVPP